uniref:Uncharacterized protein n=1 Tax=Tanacetum cinerariifolium TaxID=118510 RepID=A0A699KRC5_TANCI|nr:hypothetical protein [Tanacetum cinerariifolium]
MASAIICLVDNQKFNFSKKKQRKEAEVSHDESEDEDHVPTPSSDPLPSAKDTQAKEIVALKKKVAKLNKWRKSRSGRLRRLKKIGSGRRVKSPMEKDEIALDTETQRRTNDDEMFRVNDLAGEEVVMETTTGVKDSAAPTTDVTKDEFTMAQALAALKSTKPKVVVQEQEISTTITAAATTVTTIPNSKSQRLLADDGAEVLIEATPISSRSPTIIDYKYHKEGKKNYFKIIRADGNSQVYQTFEKIFKNFNREDLEVLWAIVKDRFKKEKRVDDMNNLLFRTLKPMFEHHVKDTIWKYQQGLAKKTANGRLYTIVKCLDTSS